MTTACAAARRHADDPDERHRLGIPPAAGLGHRRAALLVSQVLTLFTTPVVYIYLDRLRRKTPHTPHPVTPEASMHPAE